MKSLLALTLVTLAPFAVGCGTIDYDRDPAYPTQTQAPVGYTPPEQMAAAAEAQGVTAPAQVPQAPQGQEAFAGQAQVQAQTQDIAVGGGAQSDEYADTDPSALSDFRTTLDPYGSWVDDGTYGTVWVPSSSVVGGDFTPYVSAGHWTYDTEYVWVSDYSWGWAPFHYGRWAYIGGRGWGWIPGRVYSGAWVSWRVGYDDWGYVGWAPLAPSWYWYGGYAYGLSVRPYAPYSFCAYGGLFHPHLAGQVVVGSQVGVVASHTRPYVAASPAVGAGGHVPAHPSVAGPTPGSMHIANNMVPAPPAGDRGLTQARAYAHASTAQPLGARPPAQSVARGGNPSMRPGAGGVASNGAPSSRLPPTSGYRPTTPGFRNTTPNVGHATPLYRAPQYSAPQAGAAPHYAPSTPHYAPSTPHYAPSTPHYAPAPSTPHYSAPSGTYHAPSGGSSYRGSSGGGYHPSGGGFHGGGGGRGGRR
jgi:hypothetical protein